jgi:molybdopterin molybdotransferase
MVPAFRRLSLEDATAWVDRITSRLDTESTSLSTAHGRVLAEEICAAQPIPAVDSAALDGFAVAASATVGASSYNPVLLPLRAIAAGEAIPPGTDAVIPLGLGEPQPPNWVECVEAIAPGENVETQSSVTPAGSVLAPSGALLSPPLIGMLIRAGLSNVNVVRRPRVRIVVTPKGVEIDSNGPMIQALVERDGGDVSSIVAAERTAQGIRSTLEQDGTARTSSWSLAGRARGPTTMPQPPWVLSGNW